MGGSHGPMGGQRRSPACGAVNSVPLCRHLRHVNVIPAHSRSTLVAPRDQRDLGDASLSTAACRPNGEGAEPTPPWAVNPICLTPPLPWSRGRGR